MASVFLRYYGRLASFLPKGRMGVVIPYKFVNLVAVKQAIEAHGIPHTEVDLLLVNGQSVGFYHQLVGGDLISVYPAFTAIDISPIQTLRPPLVYPPRFIIDNHLGKLARNLRLLGFDCLYKSDLDDGDLAAISFKQSRVLLTRDRRLLMRKQVVYGFCISSRDPKQQLRDVIHRYQLRGYIRPWARCLRCNGNLRSVDKSAILDRLEPKTKKHYHRFHLCENCEQIYWKGSHFPALDETVKEISREDERRPI